MYSARYDPPAQEAILEAIDSGKPYRDNDFVKDLSSLDWPDYSDIVILSKRDLCYAFVHPIISAGFSKFDSVKSPGQRKKIDKIYSHASRESKNSRSNIVDLYSEIAAERALSWYRINRPELFER